MMPMHDFSEILSMIHSAVPQKNGSILVVTHERPDGDAIGALSAMCTMLRENGYSADALFPEEAPGFYASFLCPVIDTPLTAGEINKKYVLLINVDASTVKRLGLGGVNFPDITIPSITLDHHPDNECFATVNYIDPDAVAASQIVYEFAKYMDWKISKEAATMMLLGVMTDSGSFRFDNTTPEALRAAAGLIEAGADHHRIIEHVYLSKPMNMALFEAEMLCTRMKKAFDGKFVWFYLDPELMERYYIDIRNTEQLIEILRSIQGVEVAALIKPTEQNDAYKISLRSKNPDISVGKIARRLNGGGHEMAAGGTIFAATLEKAESILIQNVELELNETQS